MLVNKWSIFDILLIIFAVIGVIAVLAFAGMWIMHGSMMHGIGSCYAGMKGMFGR